MIQINKSGTFCAVVPYAASHAISHILSQVGSAIDHWTVPSQRDLECDQSKTSKAFFVRDILNQKYGLIKYAGSVASQKAHQSVVTVFGCRLDNQILARSKNVASFGTNCLIICLFVIVTLFYLHFHY
jgi:hypothetical protein